MSRPPPKDRLSSDSGQQAVRGTNKWQVVGWMARGPSRLWAKDFPRVLQGSGHVVGGRSNAGQGGRIEGPVTSQSLTTEESTICSVGFRDAFPSAKPSLTGGWKPPATRCGPAMLIVGCRVGLLSWLLLNRPHFRVTLNFSTVGIRCPSPRRGDKKRDHAASFTALLFSITQPPPPPPPPRSALFRPDRNRSRPHVGQSLRC